MCMAMSSDLPWDSRNQLPSLVGVACKPLDYSMRVAFEVRKSLGCTVSTGVAVSMRVALGDCKSQSLQGLHVESIRPCSLYGSCMVRKSLQSLWELHGP